MPVREVKMAWVWSLAGKYAKGTRQRNNWEKASKLPIGILDRGRTNGTQIDGVGKVNTGSAQSIIYMKLMVLLERESMYDAAGSS